MDTMINFLQQFKNAVVKSWEREVLVDPTYYNLVINDHISRTNKTMPFNTIKDAMSYVHEKDLMNNPVIDVQIIQINHDGKNHVLRVTTSKYVPEEA